MESEGEAIPLQDIGSVQSNVVLRRNRTSTSGTRRNVAIIEETLVSVDNNSIRQELTLLNSGENNYSVDHKFEQDAEDSISGQDDSSEILQNCKHTILKPYFTVLKLIGWRRLSLHTDIHSTYIRKSLNIFLPLLIFMLWMVGYSSQLLLCFDRSVVVGDEIKVNGTKFLYYRCDEKYLARVVIPVLLVFSSYVYGLYIFRYAQIEHLSSLTEKVYLGYTDKHGPFSQKTLLNYFRIMALIGILWLMWSLPLNILRVVSLKFTSEDTYFYFLTSYSVNDLKELYGQNNIPQPVPLSYRYILIVLSFIGFTLNDLFYIAAVLNYALQCQLMYFLVNVTVERISSSCWKVDHAIKEIKVTQDFLKVLNSELATQMSLLLFVVLQAFVVASLNFWKTYGYSEFNWSIGEITGILNIISWLFLTAFIIISAMRLTTACQKIHKLGIELRTRPFVYSKISKLDLDSFLLYTSKITLNARLVHIPMKPLFVAPVLFAIAMIWVVLTFT